MRDLTFVLLHYSAIFLLALLSYVFGSCLTRRIEYKSVLEQISFSVTLGLGYIAYLIMLLGLLGFIYSWVVLIVFLIGLSICFTVEYDRLRNLRRTRRERETSGKRPRPWALGVAAIFLIALSLPFLAPPLYLGTNAPDATSYHLACAKMFVQNHGLVFTPNLRYPVFPSTNNMLFTLALLFSDEILAQLVEFLMLVMLTLSLMAFGKRFFSKRAAVWSAAILLANSFVLWLGRVAYIDMEVMLFVTTGVYAFWNWTETRRRHWLVLAAVLCGFGVGTKQNALFFVGALTLAAFFVSFKSRRYRPAFLFATIALLVPAPWFVRSFYYTGGPLFPLFYEKFGHFFGYGQTQPEYYKGIVEAISPQGIGTGLKSLITLPWHLAFNQRVFISEGNISPIYFFALPVFLIFGITRARMRGLLILVFGYVVFWFFSFQVLRYLTVIVPLLSLVVAASLDLLLDRLPLLRGWRTNMIVTALGFVVFIWPGYGYAMKTWRELGPLPVTAEQRDRYLVQHYPSYPAYKLLNERNGRNYALYALQDTSMAYFTDGLFMGDWFGPTVFSRIGDKFFSGQALYGELRTLGANYFLSRKNPYGQEPPNDDFFNSHFKPIYEKGDTRLFELTDAPFQLRINNQLRNPDFEEQANGRLVGWQVTGAPVVDSSGQNSFNGLVAVRCNRAGDVLYQVLPVDKDASYSFSCKAHAVEAAGTGRLQIKWWDANGSLIHQDLKVINLGSKWTSYEVGIHSPENAVSATIYLSPLDPSSVWFDELSFGEVEYTSLP